MSRHGSAQSLMRASEGRGATSSLLARPAIARGTPSAAPMMASPAPAGTLQRQADPELAGGAMAMQGAASGGGAAGPSCIEEIEGEDPTTLGEPGVLTVVEFSADWCNPCKDLKAYIEQMCERFKTQPPPAPVRFFTIDVEKEGNKQFGDQYAPSNLPHVYFYVGTKERYHHSSAPAPDLMDALVAEYAAEAAQSPAWKGAKTGAFWGGLAGAAIGVGTAIGIGAGPGFGDVDPIGAVLGLVGGGALGGLLVGGGIGALAGKLGEEKKGSRRKKKKQPKLRGGGASHDPEEREADAMAAHVLQRSADSAGDPGFASSVAANGAGGLLSGAPLDAGLRHDMQSHFGRDFSHVRVHRDARAQRVTDGMQAHAVTEGSDIYFARDAFAPHTPGGRALLAHELTHVAQQDVSGPSAAPAALESEAARTSADIARGHQPEVSLAAGDDGPPLAMTRAEKTAASTFGVGAAGAALGAGIGLIAASQMQGTPYGEAAGIGALIGGVAGLIGGFFYGLFARRTSRVGAQEADALIRRRYGKYIPSGVPTPLRDAIVKPVTAAELDERFRCRHGEPPDGTLIGWTDTGTPWKGARPPAQTVPSATQEPTCNGQQLTHATPQQPVIYYQKDTPDAGILVHEGLHAISHPEFQRLHNWVNEGVTELYTRRLLADVNIAVYGTGYDANIPDAERLEGVVGEEPLAQAYFGGNLAALDRQMAAVYGPCSLLLWALSQEANKGGSSRAESILQNRGVDHCPELNLLMRIGPGMPNNLNAPPMAPATAAPGAASGGAGTPQAPQGGTQTPAVAPPNAPGEPHK